MTKPRKRTGPTCPYPDCGCRMGPLSFYCRSHWLMVPKVLRDTMLDTSRRHGRHVAVLLRPEAEAHIKRKSAVKQVARKQVSPARGGYWWQRGDLA